jgi:hypothetical protein
LRFAELFQPQTWAILHISVLRFHKDARARKLIGSLALWVLGIAIAILAIGGAIATAAFAPQAFPILFGSLGLGLGFVVRHFRAQERRQKLFDKAALEVSLEKRRQISRTTYWLAIMLRRCHSEYALLKEIPPHIQIITRRVVLDQLKEKGLWEEMPLPVRDLLLKPDGHWTPAERDMVADKFELLTTLRWITRLDASLRVLPLPPIYRFGQIAEMVKEPSWMDQDLPLAPVQMDARMKIDARYLERCAAEGIARGLFPRDEETRTRAVEYKRNIEKNAQSLDALHGPITVGELRDQDLQSVHRRAFLRWHMLRAVLAIAQPDGSAAQFSEFMADAFTIPGQRPASTIEDR